MGVAGDVGVLISAERIGIHFASRWKLKRQRRHAVGRNPFGQSIFTKGAELFDRVDAIGPRTNNEPHITAPSLRQLRFAAEEVVGYSNDPRGTVRRWGTKV